MAKGSGGTRGSAGGGSRQKPLAVNDFEGMSKALAQHYAKMTDSERYKATQELANEIQDWANEDSRFINGTTGGVTLYSQADESLGRYLDSVQKHGGFAADVAKSVSKTVQYGAHYGTVAKMSSKQAWILAKAGVEHAIPTFGSMHTHTSYKTKWTTASGKNKSKTHHQFTPIVPLKN
jgi:hypothetical protein